MFVVVNLLAGQVGVLTSLLLTWESGRALDEAWMQNLTSGALYTFSISLVVSSLAMISSELIDAVRGGDDVRFFESKVVWSILAAAVLLAQAPLVGALLSKPAAPGSQQEVVRPIEAARSVTEGPARTDSSVADSGTSQRKPEVRTSTQVIFWLLSMGIALQLYCLYRIRYVPDDRYAKMRNDEVHDLGLKAARETETEFGEKL
jgi:hypothetical protein